MPLKRLRVLEVDPDVESSDSDKDLDVTCHGDRIFFYTEVSRRSVLKLVHCLAMASEYALKHSACVHNCTVYLYIHSEGGDAYAGLSAFDHIRNNKVHVTTILDGYTASAATFLLLGGEYRVAMKHGTMLVHQLQTGFEGKFSELVDEMHNSTSLMETVKKVYADHTHMCQTKIETMLNKEKNLNAEQCLRLGFVQELW